MSRIVSPSFEPVVKTRRGPMTARKRQTVVDRDGPLCARPECSRAGEHVDHIICLAMGGEDALSNWELLCVEHHKVKTASDLKALAKAKRLAGETCVGTKRLIRSRGFDKTRSRKLQSRGFQKRTPA